MIFPTPWYFSHSNRKWDINPLYEYSLSLNFSLYKLGTGAIHKLRNAFSGHFQYPPPSCNTFKWKNRLKNNNLSHIPYPPPPPRAVRNLWTAPHKYSLKIKIYLKYTYLYS